MRRMDNQESGSRKSKARLGDTERSDQETFGMFSLDQRHWGKWRAPPLRRDVQGMAGPQGGIKETEPGTWNMGTTADH